MSESDGVGGSVISPFYGASCQPNCKVDKISHANVPRRGG